jgi:DNA-binding winged helix-turn-helix (wHTH) protein/tetratricopeptide (TPR) repeat protein
LLINSTCLAKAAALDDLATILTQQLEVLRTISKSYYLVLKEFMPHSTILCYEFGPYRLDSAQRVLTKGGEPISLTPKATEILLLLLRNAGQLIEKQELMKAVWPDIFVEEANVTQNIFTLRRVLGDDRSGARYIETVARRGYRFVAAVTTSEGLDGQSDGSVSGLITDTKNRSGSSGPPILAVLPFANDTGDQEIEYLADGITDHLINSLSRVSKLRVMSRSAVFRYKSRGVDPQLAGRELGVDAILIGKINLRPSGLGVSAELVDVAKGWQLWGESFDCDLNSILEIQDEIARQLSTTLKLRLSGDEEKRITTRYTENPDAYQAYLEGRYHWSKYTRTGIEKAVGHFRQAIELDPNYALAYAGIVDCYLRLATNYLPPEEDSGVSIGEPEHNAVDGFGGPDASDRKIKLRHEWDWKGAERELRRANELKADYPAAHQWHAAYRCSVNLFNESLGTLEQRNYQRKPFQSELKHSPPVLLTPNEEVQVLCAVVREQIEVGNFEAGRLVLQPWWIIGEWPRIEELNSHSAADLLFTVGALAGCLSSTGGMQVGQQHAEALLSGSIALFEHLGSKRRAAEARIELALSYYRQGMFSLSKDMLLRTLNELPEGDDELRSVGLIRLGVVERHAGHLHDSLAHLTQAFEMVEVCGALVTGRFHHELAITLRDLALADHLSHFSDLVLKHFHQALYEFEAIGHHRYAAVVENNHGYLLLSLGRYEESEHHLMKSRKLFDGFDDKVRRAQVDDSLAQLYLTTARLELAEQAAERAISTLELNDEEALLAEALTTQGRVYCKLNRHREARGILEGAHRVADRCGDSEGAGRALLVVIEEMCHDLDDAEKEELGRRVRKLLGHSQQASSRDRLANCLKIILH